MQNFSITKGPGIPDALRQGLAGMASALSLGHQQRQSGVCDESTAFVEIEKTVDVDESGDKPVRRFLFKVRLREQETTGEFWAELPEPDDSDLYLDDLLAGEDRVLHNPSLRQEPVTLTDGPPPIRRL